MKHFLGTTPLKLLEALSFTKTLYAFDFDGTLAKIVRDPGAANMNSQTESLLKKICALVPVAVISGRSRDDLNTRLPDSVKFTVGNHGLEGLKSQANRIKKAQGITAQWKEHFESILESNPIDGIEVEDKIFSLALHYRKCRRKKEAKSQLLQIVSTLENSPRLIMGKSVLNLIPMGAPHKGIALMELMLETGATRALYVGDDDTDEDIFSLPDERIFSVRIGKKKLSHAKYFLERQSEITLLLKKIVQLNAEKNK
ncbi:MAG: trehalose-phosphatase [Bdellovibrionales bacterium RIFCSPHIGHO2_01_FULL_40_29]|nr:MAG: trehalose-phosphatase [Bdellovibrionales bacterium RIFCSPHIGHO2_01_FULL_40_29]OFZ33576.1 MAG: trehalose-phosphatase [Bdellovibrionales bacterium RIFCSPHIGHO2_02_FULL_40_15]